MMTTSVATDVAIDTMGTAKVDMKLVAGVLAEGVRPLAHLLVRSQAACALNLGSLVLPPGLGVDPVKPITLIPVAALGDPDLLVEVDATAVLD